MQSQCVHASQTTVCLAESTSDNAHTYTCTHKTYTQTNEAHSTRINNQRDPIESKRLEARVSCSLYVLRFADTPFLWSELDQQRPLRSIRYHSISVTIRFEMKKHKMNNFINKILMVLLVISDFFFENFQRFVFTDFYLSELFYL